MLLFPCFPQLVQPVLRDTGTLAKSVLGTKTCPSPAKCGGLNVLRFDQRAYCGASGEDEPWLA